MSSARIAARRADAEDWAAWRPHARIDAAAAAALKSAPPALPDLYALARMRDGDTDQLLALAAMVPAAPGVAELVLIPDANLDGHEVSVVRFLVRHIAAAIAAADHHRVFAARRADDDRAAALHRALGLVEEGRQPGFYADGAARVIAAWVRPGHAR